MHKWVIGLWLFLASVSMATEVVLTPDNITQYYLKSKKQRLYTIRVSKQIGGSFLYTTGWHTLWYEFDDFVATICNDQFEVVKKQEIKFKVVEVQ